MKLLIFLAYFLSRSNAMNFLFNEKDVKPLRFAAPFCAPFRLGKETVLFHY